MSAAKHPKFVDVIIMSHDRRKHSLGRRKEWNTALRSLFPYETLIRRMRRYRISAFTGADVVDALPSMLMLCPENEEAGELSNIYYRTNSVNG